MLRRLITVSAVIGAALAVTACSPVQMGAAAIVGNQRITIATLDTEVTNLSQAAKQYPGVVHLTATQMTQLTLTWLIRFQINEELARQAGITISPAQASEGQNQVLAVVAPQYESEGYTNVTLKLIMLLNGIPLNKSTELGRWQAIPNQYLKIVNGGTIPASGSSAATAASNKLAMAECQAAKALNILVNPQFGQLDYSNYQVVPAPPAVSRSQGPVTTASPVATAPAC